MGRKRKRPESDIALSDVTPTPNGNTGTGNSCPTTTPTAVSSTNGANGEDSASSGGGSTSSPCGGDPTLQPGLTTDAAGVDQVAPTSPPPVQRNAANERERARMRVLSRAFTRLKTSLPWVPADTKLSKLDTLRLASCYIAHLSRLLAEDSESSTADNNSKSTNGDENKSTSSSAVMTSSVSCCGAATSTNVHPLNLTWPFTFSSRNGGSGNNASVGRVGTCDVRGVTSTTTPPLVTSTAMIGAHSNGGGKFDRPRPMASIKTST